MTEALKNILRPAYHLLLRVVLPPYRWIRGMLGRRRLARLPRAEPHRIVVGADGVFQAGWIPTDIQNVNLLKPEDWERYFSENSLAAILAEHVWEHLTEEEGLAAAKTCHRYLKPGGYLRVAVPDGQHPDPEYVAWIKPGEPGPGPKYHKTLYTYQTLTELFERAGFEVQLLEYFDEYGEFHYQDWDAEDGMIHRSRRFDERNRDGELSFTSIILDARK